MTLPPRPDAHVSGTNMNVPKVVPEVPSFGDFFGTYFAGRSFNVSNP